MQYFVVLALVAGLGLPTAVWVAVTVQSRATRTALEGITRQPEAAARLQLAMIIGLAFMESLVIYALLVFLLLFGRLPSYLQIIEILGVSG